MTNLERQIYALRSQGEDLTGCCIIRIYSTVGRCREFLVSDISFARSRIAHYANNWPLFSAATLAVFDGVCWVEIPTEE